MRKFVKGILILSLLLFLTGTGCLIAGCVMGITSGDLAKALKQLPFIDFDNGIIISEDKIIPIQPEDQFFEEGIVESFQREEVKRIHMDIAGADCNIAVSENDQITVKISGTDDIKVKAEQGILDIRSDSLMLHTNSGQIDLYLPADLILDEFDFEAGAGNVKIDCPIQAEQFEIQAGAAGIEADGKIIAKSLEVELGAGMIRLSEVDGNRIQIENGAGQTRIGLCGNKDQYRVVIESAAGSVQYGDETYAGIAKAYENNPKDADRFIQIESALGEVIVDFEEVTQ